MSDPLIGLAARVANDGFFLAAALAVYARSEGLDDAGLAARLGCTVEQLPLVRLCRAPRSDAQGRREDVAAIAGHLGLDERMLMAVVKRATVLAGFQAAAVAPTAGQLMAARDREQPPGPSPEAP
jgi:hypothetical protein